MSNIHKPDPAELPSTGRLLRSTAIAAAVAAGLLVTVVLPAEYAIDPTGLGRLLGLTQMGEVKVALAAEAEAESAAPPAAAPLAVAAAPQAAAPTVAAAAPAAPVAKVEQVTITLAPNQAAEFKAEMRKGATVDFRWSTDGPKLNFDTHGDGQGIKYHGYAKGSEAVSEGQLTAAFDGAHGWFWRNRAGKSVTLTLRVSGDFARLKRVV
ncbi:transmembrane anchor protein [Phenylobacterium sp. SCN 70-31]|uniref:transmembrane anchor protein n=1 Tax=Phenylobacterium sp. SCN 70-31 TaxID=1660129 RepID=UPI0008699DE8|nr:transmembrane anchor protein [Phenylobacterium sp. SCN 70-31]ODT89115.1 MAG: transmembrane anchor protein [Phenylobacterium sp. SCN 70-31]